MEDRKRVLENEEENEGMEESRVTKRPEVTRIEYRWQEDVSRTIKPPNKESATFPIQLIRDISAAPKTYRSVHFSFCPLRCVI